MGNFEKLKCSLHAHMLFQISMSAKALCHVMEMQHVRTHQEVTTVPVLKDSQEMGQSVMVN
jgi:hypothetical protein